VGAAAGVATVVVVLVGAGAFAATVGAGTGAMTSTGAGAGATTVIGAGAGPCAQRHAAQMTATRRESTAIHVIPSDWLQQLHGTPCEMASPSWQPRCWVLERIATPLCTQLGTELQSTHGELPSVTITLTATPDQERTRAGLALMVGAPPGASTVRPGAAAMPWALLDC